MSTNDATLRSRMPRHQVLLGAEISGFSSSSKHRVKDLSDNGVRVDRADGLIPGATVLISVGLLKAIGATVVWVKDGTAGLNFAEPINPHEAR